MIKQLHKEEKQILFVGLGLILIGIILNYIIKRLNKSNNLESNYVLPRGFFQPIQQTQISSGQGSVGPLPIPQGMGTPPQPQGMGTPPQPQGMGTPPQPQGMGTPPQPPLPIPYPYPYPMPLAYNIGYGMQPYQVIIPDSHESLDKKECYKSVVLLGDKNPTCFSNKKDYVLFLKKSYNTLVDSYNDALYSFAWKKAMKIARIMKKVKNDIYSETIII